ncbi:hypothetical protein PENTCL1PPCAC_27907, partial [Pristionchus entomophagus]
EMSREVVEEVEFDIRARGAAEERTLVPTGEKNCHVLLHEADPVDYKFAVGALATCSEFGNDILFSQRLFSMSP